MSFFDQVRRLRYLSAVSQSGFMGVSFRHLLFRQKGQNIIAHPRCVIRHPGNIRTKGELRIGMDYVGFVHERDTTFLNIRGKLITGNNVSINRGCRIDILPNATVNIGDNTYINPFTKIVIAHGLLIGADCAISWDCQFLDEDFHRISYEGKWPESGRQSIRLGDKVWLGSGVSVFKGSSLANGTIVAAGSVVKGVFTEENTLLAGNPVKVIKRNVQW